MQSLFERPRAPRERALDRSSRPRAHRGLLRFRRWLFLIGSFAIAIPIAAASLIQSSNAHGRVRALAISAIRDELGLEAHLGPVQIELVPLAIVARDIALDDRVYGRLADAASLRIQPSFAALIRGDLELAAIELDRATVHLVVREEGIMNLPHIEGGEPGGGPPTLPFRRLAIHDATLFVDGAPWASGELYGVDVEVRGEPNHVIAVDAQVARGAVRRDGQEQALRELTAHVAVGQDAIDVDALSVSLGPLSIGADDVHVPLPPPTTLAAFMPVRGHVEVAADLATLSALPLPFPHPHLEGRARVAVDVTNELEATATIDLQRGRVEQFGLGDTLHLALHATPEEVELTSGRIAIDGGGAVDIQARLGLTPDLPVHVVARPRALSFAKLMSEFQVSQNSIVEWLFDGSLVLDGSLADIQRGVVHFEGPIDLDTHDFTVSKNPYHERPLRVVIAIPRGHFGGRWSIDERGVHFDDLVADLPHSRIFGNVLLGFHNELRVHARADADLRDVSPLDRFQMAGAGPATCEIEGIFQDPRVTGHVRLAGFEFDGFRLGDVESDAILDRDGLGVTFPHVTARKRDSVYSVDDIYLDFHRGRFAMRGELGLDRMTLADFYHVFHFEDDERFAGYQGVLRGNASLSYTNGYPDDAPAGTLRVRYDVAIPTATLNGYTFDDGRARGTFDWFDWTRGYRGAVVELEHAELHKGEGVVTLAGSMQREGILSFFANADRVALADVEGVGDRLIDIDGIASVTADITGTADEMRVDADVLVHEMVVAGREIGESRLYVRLTNPGDPWITDSLASEPRDSDCVLARRGLATANWPADPPVRTVDGPMERLSRPQAFIVCGAALDGAIDIDLAIGRQLSYPLRGRVAARDLSLERLLPAASGSYALPSERTRGVVAADLRILDGGFLAPETLEGRLRIERLDVTRGELDVHATRPIRVAFSEGVARVEGGSLAGAGLEAHLRGDVSLERGLGLELGLDLDLAALARATPSVREAEGRAALRLALSGPLTDPEYYGEGTIDASVVRLEALAAPIENVHARARFSSRRASLEAFSADLYGGRLEASGEATLEGRSIEQYSVDLHARDIVLHPSAGIDAELSADTTMSFHRGDNLPVMRGDVRVSRFMYTRDIDVNLGSFASIESIGRAERAEVENYDPLADYLALDLTVRREAPFVVRNNLIEAEVEIVDTDRPFRIVGTNQLYGALGDMRFSRGRVFLRNQAFELRPGSSLSFDDERTFSPRFAVHAMTEVRRSGDINIPTWRILLDANGSVDSFTLTTRSDPELPQEDVILLLTIGMTRSEAQRLSAGDWGGTALEALASVTGVDREVRRAIPVIDDFRLESAYSVRTGRTEPQITIGKRIADRVRLSATTGLTDQRTFRAQLEGQISETTSVRAGYDNYNLTNGSSFGNLGVDLRWRLEFE